MMKKFIIFNIILLIVFGYKFYKLGINISPAGVKSDQLSGFDSLSVKRPTLQLESAYSNIFDIQEVKPTPTPTSQSSKVTRPVGQDLMNEYSMEDTRLRILGVFTETNRRFTLIEISHKGSEQPKKVKVSKGDKVLDLIVTDIQSQTVSLSTKSNDKVVNLKIFTRGPGN